jgi:hypothetical protein
MAKRSRRARKQSSEKEINVESSTVAKAPVTPVEAPEEAAAPSLRQKAIDFSEEYYYVYTDLRNVTAIAVVMFVLMFSLGYFL